MSFDPFEVEQDGELSDEEKQKIIDYHTMIHETFRTDSGKKLLHKWTEDYVFQATVIPGQPLEAHGINEGKASFVRHILKTIVMVDDDYEQLLPTQENSSDE